MQKGFIKFLKPYKLNDRSFKKDEIVSWDELELTKEDFKKLIEQKAVVPCQHRDGSSHGDSVSIRG
jgi:hypothetical protein